MIAPFDEQIRSVLDAVRVNSRGDTTWFGMTVAPAPNGALTQVQRDSLTTVALSDHLYRHFYCTGTAVPFAAGIYSPDDEIDAARFATALSEANTPVDVWDEGWHLREATPAGFELVKNELSMIVAAEDCRPNPSRAPSSVVKFSVRAPRGSFHRSPGYYTISGTTPSPEDDRDSIARIYWNIRPSGAPALLRALTSRLDDAGRRYQLKALDDPRNYTRCDAVVLYIPMTAFGEFQSEHAGAVIAAVADQLSDAVPALTQRIAPGVGAAVDPANHQDSFGTHRCGALARALVDAHDRDLTTDERLRVVQERFEDAGIDSERPYRDNGSQVDFQRFPPWTGVGRVRPLNRPAPANAARVDWLESACRIGESLCRTAIWHGNQCTWTGSLGPTSPDSPRARYGTVGTTVYGGSSGIALFLAELTNLVDATELRQTALGAIEHAMNYTIGDANAAEGFYLGGLGTATVAAKIGRQLDRVDLIERAQLLGERETQPDAGFDLMAGAAGRVVGYLTLDLALGDAVSNNRFVDAASSVGNQIVRRAKLTDRGASWGTPELPERWHLTGLSHGTAGAAMALLELFAVCGDDTYRRTANLAMAYERSLFDERHRNWPDLRNVPNDTDPSTVQLPYSCTWCHGAPGIALVRVRAAEVLGDHDAHREATIALRTTRDHLRDWVDGGHVNYSLCHGIAGNADVLLSAHNSAVESASGLASVAEDALRRGVLAYGDDPVYWPCGVGGGGSNPGLMLGWAGIGHVMLRLHSPHITSPLAPLAGHGAQRSTQ